MNGMNRETGTSCEGLEYLKQSIRDILTTPLGARVMRREYGSRLFLRIDNPINGDLVANIYSDVVEALFNLQPDFELLQVIIKDIQKSKIVLDLAGRYLANGQIIKLENIEITSKK